MGPVLILVLPVQLSPEPTYDCPLTYDLQGIASTFKRAATVHLPLP
uniref:Uncharacterized protein n=1 Tax=Anguilla anguilla TaxID=7936 RepID=A0A0E9PX11_ANGAN